MLRTDSLAHPNFDKDLSRRARFVITGRLIGGAPLAARQFREHLETLGETELRTSDRDTVVDMLAVDPICLSGSPLGLIQILGSQHDQLDFRVLESYSRGWIRSAWNALNLRDSLEAAVIASHCRRQNRIDLACYTALMLHRSTLATVHGQIPLPESASVALRTAKDQFRYYASQIWEDCRDNFLHADQIIQGDPTPAAFITYPTRCLTVIEMLGMLGLLEAEIDERSNFSREIVAYLEEFIHANVGTTHPISDRWCISLVVAVLLLAKFGKAEAAKCLIRLTTKWIADYHDNGNFGLAQPHALPAEEVAYLLGPPFEQISLRRRSESYLAVAVLDLASVLEEAELYDLARNEFLAVDVVLPVIEMGDDQGQYCLHTGEHRFEPNMPFAEYWKGAGGRMRHITIEEPIFTIPKKSGALGINWPSVVSCEIDILKRVGAEFWASRREPLCAFANSRCSLRLIFPPFHIRFMAKSRAPFGSFCQSRLCSSARRLPQTRAVLASAPLPL